MFNEEKDEDKEWIRRRVVDKEIDKLSMSDEKKKKIKSDYKSKGWMWWKKGKEDEEIGKKNEMKERGRGFVNDKKAEDGYEFCR
ncbi:hypothetical protein [Staphylococcus epidermidis]|uniref:hypothetical protein n=1 Tax=Staphylococcus epidermidis TaxID=1282 RepID=UPI0011A0AF54|nr:hypothetical protein [Staphylococcus epidermidis]